MSSTAYFRVVTPVSMAGVADDIAAALGKNVGQRTIGQTPVATDQTTAIVAALAAQALGLKSNELVRIAVNATSGTWTATFGAATTSALQFNATAAQVEAALVALSTIDAGDVIVSGGPGDSGATTPYYVQFVGSKAGTDVGTLSVTDVTLSGGGDTVVATVIQAGGLSPQ